MEKQRKIITKELRLDKVGLFEVTFINDKVVSVKDINGCIVKNNEVILDYVNREDKNK